MTVSRPFTPDEWDTVVKALIGHPPTASIACTGELLSRLVATVNDLKYERARLIAELHEEVDRSDGYRDQLNRLHRRSQRP